MSNLILDIISLGTKRSYDFHALISEFRGQLESSENDEDVAMATIDSFYDKLNSFDSRFLYFSKYYRKYIANLNRLKPEPEDTHPDLTLLRVALTENKWKPTKPLDIFVHQIKYDYKLTSKPFIAYEKKQNRKRLNSPKAKVKEINKPERSENWTRVPLPNHRCGCGNQTCKD